MAGNIGIFWVDREPLITAVLPRADGLDEGHCLNSPRDDDPMESRCDAPTRVCGGVDAALDQVSYAPTISCVILACITLYEHDRVLDRPT